MKIILFTPPWSKIHGKYSGLFKILGENTPLGLAYLARSVKELGVEVRIIDGEIERHTPDSLAEEISSFKADVVGISATTPLFDMATQYARRIKELSAVFTVVGGPHITALKEAAFNDAFDFAVMGEGEIVFKELINALNGDKNFSAIKGLIYRSGNSVKVNGPQSLPERLDDLGWPDRSLLSNSSYKITVPHKGEITATGIIASRGCPFHCTFCAAPKFYNGKVRFREPAHVVDEMQEVINEFGISHFRFFDETLTLNKAQIVGICDEIRSRGLNLTWEGWTRADLVDRALIKTMKNAGFVRISFGLESADPEVLKIIKKDVSVEQIRKAIDLCASEGIEVTCSVMIGNPGETRKTILKTIKFLRSLDNIPYVPFSIAIPYPGTEFYDMAKKGEHGLKLLTEDYSKYIRYNQGVVEINGLTPRELLKWQKWGLVWIHSRLFRIKYLLNKMGFKFMTFAVINFFKKENPACIKTET